MMYHFLTCQHHENQLIQAYVAANNLNTSSFIRDLVIDKIEEDMSLDEARILKSAGAFAQRESIRPGRSVKELGL